jgi:hypothetical protein
VILLYQNYYPNYYYDENGQLGYNHPSYSETAYQPYIEERQFGSPLFPNLGGLVGPPSGPPPGQGVPGQQPPLGSPGQGQGATSGPPTAPPPSFVPQQQIQTFAVDPGGIRGCLFRYTYIWLNNRQQFWFYPTFVGRTSVSGWRWNGFRWLYFGISLQQIQSFTCV